MTIWATDDMVSMPFNILLLDIEGLHTLTWFTVFKVHCKEFLILNLTKKLSPFNMMQWTLESNFCWNWIYCWFWLLFCWMHNGWTIFRWNWIYGLFGLVLGWMYNGWRIFLFFELFWIDVLDECSSFSHYLSSPLKAFHFIPT